MATLAFTNAKFQINAVDLSDHVKNVTINYSSAVLDDTRMGNTFQARIAGLKDADLSVTFGQDFASGEVDATVFSLVGTDSCVEIRGVNACSSANNPIYFGNFLLDKYTPLSGNVGTYLAAPLTFKIANGILNRASSS